MWEMVKKAIIELLWPIIRDLIVQLVKEMSDWLIGKVKTWAAKRNNSNADAADAKADEYERSAKDATNQKEAEVNAEVAKVWREVAETFRKENEALSVELKRLKAEAATKAKDAVQGMNFEDVIREKDGKLSVKKDGPKLLK